MEIKTETRTLKVQVAEFGGVSFDAVPLLDCLRSLNMYEEVLIKDDALTDALVAEGVIYNEGKGDAGHYATKGPNFQDFYQYLQESIEVSH